VFLPNGTCLQASIHCETIVSSKPSAFAPQH
jgi:hypothetical protein